ncbi:LacI family DNA-binding transcriptional regulator [Cryptosporangium arvum]|uniref:Transcriptional regulator n=1 Tax=Cryptosporangium arvum DSM 44712 TaxID=927661 RepID=A0A011AFI6_9ACTN|nr:LacI family DNA-binding transcriptional regulator [Cryptosporangium arvum]EXG80766.1 transcriptional regulator [Cryptosporangium arvum DSM 44712]
MATFTSKDVARLAGVSQSTVSYVMSGKRPISEETRRRVLDAIDRLTYEPNAGARALASQRTKVVGLVVPFGVGVDTTGLLPFIETIAGAARARDHDVLLVTADEGSAGIRRLAGRSLCDAIILMDLQTVDDRLAVAANVRTPVILIGVPADPHGMHCVDLDFAEAARLAVGELAATGHDRLALIGHPADIVLRDLNYVRRFADAARSAAAGHGLPLEIIAPVEWGREAAGDAAARLAAIDARRLGVVVPASNTVQPLLHALNARGLVPGRDLSVIGLLTDAAAAEGEPPVTNVSLEPRDVSRRAMQTLFRLLEDRTAPPLIDLITPQLTRRQTVLPGP